MTHDPRVSRRGAIRAVASFSLAALAACERSAERASRVVLYSSADDEILRQVVAAFEKGSGIRVGVVTDTEATKTTGLVQRLLDEKDRPRADVWWSSEPLGTIKLAREGVLAGHAPGPEASGRPAPLNIRAPWFILPGRARVIAYSRARVEPGAAPRRLRDLAAPRWKGRVGMARPQFGTTRSHMAALVALEGEPALRGWLTAMRDNGLRLYDGNASVVRAIGHGEIDAGLTDTDDVHAAARNSWPIGMHAEEPDAPGTAPGGLPSRGAIILPNTAARIAGGPNPEGGARLLDFLLGVEVERLLASHESRHIPVRESLEPEFASNAIGSPAPLSYDDLADAVPVAMTACRDVLGA